MAFGSCDPCMAIFKKSAFLSDAGMDPAVINDPSLWFQDVQASNNVYLLVKGSDH